MTDVHRPLLGEPDAPCRTCGSPLAADQRYCLQCGERRAEARLPFLDILAQRGPGAPTPPAAAVAPDGPASRLARASANTVAVAGVACLLLALGVGVLIGGLGTDDGAASSATPQIISVGGAAPASSATPAAAAAPTATATTPAPPATTSTSTTPAAATSTDASKAGSTAVKKISGATGADYVKKSSKLPKELGTGGAPPPKDNKPAGGGGDFEDIG